ncbi:TIGR00282 family metallophosphoesterase [Sulfuriroseicoccus oceanibius]|uniref:TIGR00282 family metallophosphoesterase n=1 Tax=Sulfuriroseicoccus oceanibius TaxID=2707525 RepID=A0A6B3LDM6_9BACT|nr:TIGR00282 family metallophosphoesterase [Sulfuriroseicoccus oceanibius]QQL45463.1 TIGR00282 family metallophosphoesterase [Sulfuriroseicoccus oceanibius]
MRILFLGDVVGEPGRKAVKKRLPILKEQYQADFIVINGENSAGGRGITPKICTELLRAGAAVITTGDHVWDQKEIVAHFASEPRLLRPINWPEGTPGAGSVVLETEFGKVAVINAQGRTFVQPPLENPFTVVDKEVTRLRDELGVKIIFVDFHAETTSEKIGFGRCFDGRISAMVGTHTHVQTADERVFPNGTAYLTDSGMCGPDESILGRKIEPIVERFKTQMPVRFPVASGRVRLCGAVIDINPETGLANSIERIQDIVEP